VTSATHQATDRSGRSVTGALSADPLDFAPPLLRIQAQPPVPVAHWLLRSLIALASCVVLWAALARLDIVAVSDGKLVPASYLKIVQPAEQGIVREILVKEGQSVEAGQVLIRMDAVLTQADVRSTQAEFDNKRLALRRIDAQLNGTALTRAKEDAPDLYARVEAQYHANVRAYENALAQERTLLEKARHDLAAAEQAKAKLEQVLPHYVDQERAYEKLARDGFAGRIMAADKARERIEKEQDLRTQEHMIRSNIALIAQQERKIAQITADYRRQLQTERVDVAAQLERASQELAKQALTSSSRRSRPKRRRCAETAEPLRDAAATGATSRRCCCVPAAARARRSPFPPRGAPG